MEYLNPRNYDLQFHKPFFIYFETEKYFENFIYFIQIQNHFHFFSYLILFPIYF
jgi:hypothetical protein